MLSLNTDCVHHWIIETPQQDKETVRGECKFCKLSRDFPGFPDSLSLFLVFELNRGERDKSRAYT